MAEPLNGPVLLIGVGGMLWRAWDALLRTKNIEPVSPSLTELDITDSQSVDRVLTDRYRLVVNCAAWTDVDGAETREADATRINGEGVANLARRCRQTGAMLVHYSTDYVFDGNAGSPYAVDHPRQPLGAYGRSKAAGEEALERSGAAHLLIRTSWMYAPWGNNFVRTMARLMRDRESIRVVNDQRGRPTSAEHLAASTLKLLERNAAGTFHVTDGGECSWYQFATQIGKLLGSRCRVEPCTTAEFPRPARRPAYSVLDLSRTMAQLGAMPPWPENLANVIERLEPL